MKALFTATCLLMMLFRLGDLLAQDIEMSPPQKEVAKYDDYEVVGRNTIGTVVHYYTKSNHKLQIFNSKLRPFNEIDLNFEEKKSAIEKIHLSKDHILIFYSVIENNYEYLKVKKVNYRLDIFREGIMLDSIERGAINLYEGYYVKSSLNDEYYVAFTFEEKNNRMVVRYILMDNNLQVLRTGESITEDKDNMTLESVKVNNAGDILVVIGHKYRRAVEEENFSYDQFTVHFIAGDGETTTKIVSDEDYVYKDLVTNWNESARKAILVGTYRKLRNDQDIGLFYLSMSQSTGNREYTKIAFKEEDFNGSDSPYRKWEDNAEIQIPKRIIPRSDGGYIFITEAEYHDYRLISTNPGVAPGYSTYPEYTNYYDENHYYDLTAYSIDPDGTIDWKIKMPKYQVTENDQGRYSSYFYVGNDNITKLLFVDDIYNNGNLTEFNFNPNGQWNKRVLLNSYRDDLMLVPQKGVQVSSSEIILPSEKKNRLRLVKITY